MGAVAREISDQQLAAYLIAFFGEGKDFVFTDGDIVACNCNRPRGYWFGMPLIYQRQPNHLRLDRVVVINAPAKVYIRYVACPMCNNVFIKEEDSKSYVKPKQVCGEPSPASQSKN